MNDQLTNGTRRDAWTWREMLLIVAGLLLHALALALFLRWAKKQ